MKDDQNLQKKRERSEEKEEALNEDKKNSKKGLIFLKKEETLTLGSNELLYSDFNREKNDNRVVPKSSKPESKCLLITNLQRPFSNTVLNELLSKTGTIKRFWLDFIKTHCYVEYETIDQARETRQALYGTIWPIDGKRLIVEFATESDLSAAIEKKVSPYSLQQENGNNGNIANSRAVPKNKEKSLEGQERKATDNTTQSKEIVNNSIEEPIKTLDSLFKKTLTKPHIYYLPLSEEEVKEKLKKLIK